MTEKLPKHAPRDPRPICNVGYGDSLCGRDLANPLCEYSLKRADWVFPHGPERRNRAPLRFPVYRANMEDSLAFASEKPMRVVALSIVIFLVGCGAGSANDGGGGGLAAGSGGLAGVAGSMASGGSARGATTSASGASSSMLALPGIVAIDTLGALIDPRKSNDAEWDGTGSIPAAIVDGLSTATGQPEVGPLLDFMPQSAIKSLSAPDPFGLAELDPDGSGFDATLVLRARSASSRGVAAGCVYA